MNYETGHSLPEEENQELARVQQLEIDLATLSADFEKLSERERLAQTKLEEVEADNFALRQKNDAAEDEIVSLKVEKYELIHDLAVSENLRFIGDVKLEGAQFINKRDAETNMLTKTAWREELSQTLKEARKEGYDVGIAWLDVDKFKLVNTIFGHLGADKIIKGLASKLSRESRIAEDSVGFGEDLANKRFVDGRYGGGDEFVVFGKLNQIYDFEDRRTSNRHDSTYSFEGFKNHIKEIIDEFIEEHPEVTSAVPDFGISVGFVSTIGREVYDVDSLLEEADTLMYEDKNRSK